MRRLSENVVVSVSIVLFIISVSILLRIADGNVMIYLWLFTFSTLLFSLSYRATVLQNSVQAKRYLVMAFVAVVFSVIMVLYSYI